jgi:phosphoserine phosphatase
MKLVDAPVAVNPDPVLAQYAKDHDWPVISLR